MERKVKWWAASYRPGLDEMDGVCAYMCTRAQVELSLVRCWLRRRWRSAGQMVLLGRWVNNDVSPQCSNYLLPDLHGRVPERIWTPVHGRAPPHALLNRRHSFKVSLQHQQTQQVDHRHNVAKSNDAATVTWCCRLRRTRQWLNS